jgi:hypothetical protein
MESKRTTDQLLVRRAELNSLLNAHGIPYNENDRVHQTYKQLEKYLDRMAADPEASPTGPDMLMLLDVAELEVAILSLKQLPPDIFALKWGRLKSGTTDRTAETANNSEARNTQFELMLHSELTRSGAKAFIREPNPDIELVLSGRIYSIQCKRVFSGNSKSVESAMRKACTQLEGERKTNPHRLGIVALQIDRTFTEGSKLLPADNHDDGSSSILVAHNHFMQDNDRFFRDADILKSPRVAGLLLYSSIVGPVSSTHLVTHFTQLDIADALQTKPGQVFFDQLRRDIKPCLNNFKGRFRRHG